MSLAVLALATTLAAGPSFIEDDYPKALAAARKQKKILFVDAWAPWCHTCIYLKEHVLTRPGFRPYQKEVVFAAVNTEKPSGVPLLEKFPVNSWPTLFFIDPDSERLLFKWEGTTDEVGMRALLDAATGQAEEVKDADALLAGADAGEAADAYQAALEKLPSEKSHGRAVLSMLSALWRSQRYTTCADKAVEQLPRLATPSERALGLTWGLMCALRPAPDQRPGSLAELTRAAEALLASKDADRALVDDMSGLYEQVVEAHAETDEDAAKAVAARWLAFLDRAAAKARTPAQRAVYDPHRVSAAIAAGTPGKVVKALEQSEREFPADYNPPARLALLHLELGELDRALAAADRALEKSEGGPRKLRLYETKAQVLRAREEDAKAKQVMAEALAFARALPRAQFPAARLEAYEKKWGPAAP